MSKRPPKGVIGILPSRRGGRPAGVGLHASQVAQEWEDVSESYVRRRQEELGIPEHQRGQPDYEHDGRWRAFDPYGRKGGGNTTGVVVDSGVLNPELLKGKKGGRIWPKTRLKDRIDAIIAHDYEEPHRGSHVEALKAAPRTELPISAKARRLCRAMAR
jgi:hypothetical protein